jgi:hypothetical protein
VLEHRLPKPLRPLEVGRDDLLRRLDDGQAAFYLGNDALLFCERWQGN